MFQLIRYAWADVAKHTVTKWLTTWAAKQSITWQLHASLSKDPTSASSAVSNGVPSPSLPLPRTRAELPTRRYQDPGRIGWLLRARRKRPATSQRVTPITEKTTWFPRGRSVRWLASSATRESSAGGYGGPVHPRELRTLLVQSLHRHRAGCFGGKHMQRSNIAGNSCSGLLLLLREEWPACMHRGTTLGCISTLADPSKGHYQIKRAVFLLFYFTSVEPLYIEGFKE